MFLCFSCFSVFVHVVLNRFLFLFLFPFFFPHLSLPAPPASSVFPSCSSPCLALMFPHPSLSFPSLFLSFSPLSLLLSLGIFFSLSPLPPFPSFSNCCSYSTFTPSPSPTPTSSPPLNLNLVLMHTLSWRFPVPLSFVFFSSRRRMVFCFAFCFCVGSSSTGSVRSLLRSRVSSDCVSWCFNPCQDHECQREVLPPIFAEKSVRDDILKAHISMNMCRGDVEQRMRHRFSDHTALSGSKQRARVHWKSRRKLVPPEEPDLDWRKTETVWPHHSLRGEDWSVVPAETQPTMPHRFTDLAAVRQINPEAGSLI